jgi:hypothetical protein
MGYTQVHGIDYDKVFAPTLRQETFWLVCSLLACHCWKARQVDFKTAFLNGRLEEAVYMEQPQGFEDPTCSDWVCEVNQSIYGLKQSPHKWNLELHKALLEISLTQSTFYPTLYFQLNNQKIVGTVAVHVDDLAIAGEPWLVNKLIKQLGAKFTIGTDEDMHHFLLLKTDWDINAQLVFLSQLHYIEDMGIRFLGDSQLNVLTPTGVHFKLLVPRMPTDQPSSGP